MKTKIGLLILALALVCALAACSNKAANTTPAPSAMPTTTPNIVGQGGSSGAKSWTDTNDMWAGEEALDNAGDVTRGAVDGHSDVTPGYIDGFNDPKWSYDANTGRLHSNG